MIKRIFDILFSLLGLVVVWPVLMVCWILAMVDTTTNGLFIQERIGQYGKTFKIYKWRTIQVPTHSTPSISRIGRFLRIYKLDELPQLFNVLKGDMSIVGPRPDVAGYYDLLEKEDQVLLQLKPGLTSLASLKYSNEDTLLASQKNPLHFNDTVVFPDKVKMNVAYYYSQSFWGDMMIILKTVLSLFRTK